MAKAPKKTPRKKTPPGEIAAHYRQLIEDGTLSPGDKLPSMREVSEKFGASPTTVNLAFRMLKSEQLTYAKPGVGTVVAEQPRVAAAGAARLHRMGRTGERYAPDESSIRHQAALRSCADPDIADALNIDSHDEVVLRSRVFLRDGQPSVRSLSCIHSRAASAVPEILSTGPSERFWQELYTERTGREITRSPERRLARLASDDELDALSVVRPPSAAVPVLVLVNVFYDEEGPIEYWEDVYAPGMWQVEGDHS
ncbi:GntR family transcriptional regulator [Streptomyces fenghuangensis]